MKRSQPDLIELERALDIVLESAAALEVERVPLRGSLGRYLAVDVDSAEPVPSLDNSAMDGWAVRAEDTRGARPGAPVSLTVVGESRAGRPAELSLGAGEAIGISTGAAIPAGADAVVRIEQTRSENSRSDGSRVDPGGGRGRLRHPACRRGHRTRGRRARGRHQNRAGGARRPGVGRCSRGLLPPPSSRLRHDQRR